MRMSWKWLYGAALLAGVLGVLVATGCDSFGRFTRKDAPGPGGNMRVTSGTPTAPELVAHLNNNARLLQTLQVKDLDLQASLGNETVGLMGRLACQQPRNFRMQAELAGGPAADLGSNQQEFWFWIAKNEPPYLFHCAHQDFTQGRTVMKFPIQPEWVMEVLGMAEHAPNGAYKVDVKGPSIELSEPTVTPQGQQVRKIIVFRRQPSLEVTAYILQDLNGKEICSARISSMGRDRSGAWYPKNVMLSWPADRMRLGMRLSEVTVNPNLPPSLTASLFNRPNLSGVQSYDLARGPDTQSAGRQQLQPAGGFQGGRIR